MVNRKVKVKAYPNAHGSITRSHDRNIEASEQELEDSQKKSDGVAAGLEDLEVSQFPSKGLSSTENASYSKTLASIKDFVADTDLSEVAHTISMELDSLPEHSGSPVDVVRACGATYAYADARYRSKLDDPLTRDNFKSLRESINRQFLPAEDAAFIQGIVATGPDGLNIARGIPESKLLNYVNHDQRMSRTVDDISRKYWRESFGQYNGFRDAKDFDNLTEKQQKSVRSFHEHVAVSSIKGGDFENFTNAANNSLTQRYHMFRFNRIRKQIDALSYHSDKEQQVWKDSADMDSAHRSRWQAADKFEEQGWSEFSDISRRMGYDAYFESRAAQKKGNRMSQDRFHKKYKLEEKASEMKSAPWWLRRNTMDYCGISPAQFL